MPLHFETGHPVSCDVKPVDAKTVRVVNEEGRCLFEISIGGLRTIEIVGVEMVKVDGVVCGSQLLARPRATNVLEISVAEYGEVK